MHEEPIIERQNGIEETEPIIIPIFSEIEEHINKGERHMKISLK
jgi:hypothetical protein